MKNNINTIIDVSIVIVNYNVKDYLHQCLTSIEQAAKTLAIEIFVVDNNSTDGSIDFLKPLFPEVNFICSETNLGFGRANNIAIKVASGKYLLILNPDTILAENTLSEMLAYMNNHSEVGIAGCKVLNADGSFQFACRRGFPTPWASFCKLFGLQKLFPHSKLFAAYNQTYQSEDETYYIDAVIGAFMFCNTKLIQEIGGFDEQYFMYGEDLDLCRQVQLRGQKVAYYHKTNIIHYKGESTRRSSLDEIKQQYNAMQIFAKKYFSNSFIFIILLRLGIHFRSILARLFKALHSIVNIHKNTNRRVIIAGRNEKVDAIIETISKNKQHKIHIIGIINTAGSTNYSSDYKVLGNFEDISDIATTNDADEIIIADTNLSSSMIMTLMASSKKKIQYHIIPEYDDLVIDRVINAPNS